MKVKTMYTAMTYEASITTTFGCGMLTNKDHTRNEPGARTSQGQREMPKIRFLSSRCKMQK
jgi:hypothetical protein